MSGHVVGLQQTSAVSTAVCEHILAGRLSCARADKPVRCGNSIVRSYDHLDEVVSSKALASDLHSFLAARRFFKDDDMAFVAVFRKDRGLTDSAFARHMDLQLRRLNELDPEGAFAAAGFTVSGLHYAWPILVFEHRLSAAGRRTPTARHEIS